MGDSEKADSNGALLTVKDVATKLKIDVRTAYKYLKDGVIPGKKVGKNWYVHAADLDRSLRSEQSAVDGKPRGLHHSGRPQSAMLLDSVRNMETILAELKDSLSHNILITASNSGVEAIYPPRRASEETNEAFEKLILNAKGEILLYGIALRQFFHDRPFKKSLWERLTQKPAVQLRALLLDPFSHAAMARAFVEEPFEGKVAKGKHATWLRKSTLFQDVSRSADAIAHFQKQFGADRVDARFYDHSPIAFFIMTHEAVIVEQYHFGQDESPIGGCIGELVPLFRLGRECDSYKIMKSSFNHVWNSMNPFISTRELNQILKAIPELRIAS